VAIEESLCAVVCGTWWYRHKTVVHLLPGSGLVYKHSVANDACEFKFDFDREGRRQMRVEKNCQELFWNSLLNWLPRGAKFPTPSLSGVSYDYETEVPVNRIYGSIPVPPSLSRSCLPTRLPRPWTCTSTILGVQSTWLYQRAVNLTTHSLYVMCATDVTK
jgi:hypothetical protein